MSTGVGLVNSSVRHDWVNDWPGGSGHGSGSSVAELTKITTKKARLERLLREDRKKRERVV